MYMCMWLSSFFCPPVPISTYLLGPTEKQEMKHYVSVSLENGGELCENVTYLGKNRVTTVRERQKFFKFREKSRKILDVC